MTISNRHHYLVKAGICLVILALIVGIAGCNSDYGPVYTLIISSTEGGSVIEPGEGIFTHTCPPDSTPTPRSHTSGLLDIEPLKLVAQADEGYRFVEWVVEVGWVDPPDEPVTYTGCSNLTVTAHFVAVYNLTIYSTTGGSVILPGDGTFTYDAGTVVDLVVEADEAHNFVTWTGDVGTIADINDATTNITMNGNYSIAPEFFESSNITQGAAGGSHTVGLKEDGTIVAVGNNESEQCYLGWILVS